MGQFEERGYQDDATRLAIDCLREHGGFGLFAEQRTGKTVVTCRVLLKMLELGMLAVGARLLIVCPEIALGVWDQHFKDAGLFERLDIRFQTTGSFRERSMRGKLKRWHPDMIVVDELHHFKGYGSKQSRGLRIISRDVQFKLGLTGTPQETGLEDYWAQCAYFAPDLFGTWPEFKEAYCVMGGFKGKKIVGYRNEVEFRRLLHSRSFRVELEEVKPVKTNIAPDHLVTFDLGESRSAYDSMQKKFIVELNDGEAVRVKQSDGSFGIQFRRVVAPRAITQAMKLHQLSGGFILDEGTVHHIGDEKLTHAGALCLALGNVPQVYFVRFVPELWRLGALLKLLGRAVTFISGDKRHKYYVSGTPFDVAVVQIASGVSIDLSHAEEAIFYSWEHSYLKYAQAAFRIRSYHGRRARYHYLIANNTIDVDLYQVVKQKSSFAKLILNKYRRK